MGFFRRQVTALTLRRPFSPVFTESSWLLPSGTIQVPTFGAFRISEHRFHTSAALQSWLLPKSGDHGSTRKGRPRVATGGSTRGTTVVWGDYGMRMTDHHRRLSALQLKNAEDTIRKKLRGMKYRLYTRISANIPVYTKGNETRMGTGKGSMDFWAARVPVGRVIFEIKGEIHAQIIKDAFRVASAKIPGNYETIKKGDVPIMGITKLTPENVEKLMLQKHRTIFPPPNKESFARPSSPPIPSV